VQVPRSLNSKNQSFRPSEGKNPRQSTPLSIRHYSRITATNNIYFQNRCGQCILGHYREIPAKELFYDSPTKIIVWNNYVTMPETSDTAQIIAENHASATGAYKGVTKTYKRIRHNYF